jgi:signal transduction histidine kinase
MLESKLFNRTRWTLTLWYAGVMGAIVIILGVVAHSLLVKISQDNVNQDLSTLSEVLYESLEQTLESPGVINVSDVKKILPSLCLKEQSCPDRNNKNSSSISQTYSVRFLNLSGQVIADISDRKDFLPLVSPNHDSYTINVENGKQYHIHIINLNTIKNQPWGYLQVARSTDSLDQYILKLHLILVLVLPLAILLVGGTSWWLSGLAMRPIYNSYERIQQFTADAAHELRTPLTATRSTVESAMLLGSSISGIEAYNTLEIVNRQVIRLAQLAQDLLLLSRIDQRSSEEFKSCCLSDIINDLEEELASFAMESQIELTINSNMSEQLHVFGNEEQLYRLFTNLITNAIYYTPAHGNVSIMLQRNTHTVLIQIQDTGIGISPSEQGKIFDRFYRVNSERSRQTGGAGLGLAIVQSIVIAHRGTIHLQSQLMKGSLFVITLPLIKELQ